jgi:hypothetical protein
MNTAGEEALEPQLPIIAPHHHRYDRPKIHYVLKELVANASGGHAIRQTDYVETTAMQRASGLVTRI